MRVLLSGGGTAGHVNPAIAIAKYIQEQTREDKYAEQISMKEYLDQFTGKTAKQDK